MVRNYLDNNKDFLYEYVLENVDADTLERWFIRKGRMRAMTSSPSFSSPVMIKKSKKGVSAPPGESEKRKILDQLTKEVQEHTSSPEVLLHLSQAVSSGVQPCATSTVERDTTDPVLSSLWWCRSWHNAPLHVLLPV